MTRRGEETRAKLIEATRQVVRDVGYAHASTRAIAHAAGVAEGTMGRAVRAPRFAVLNEADHRHGDRAPASCAMAPKA